MLRVLDGEVLYLLADCFAMVDYDGLGRLIALGVIMFLHGS